MTLTLERALRRDTGPAPTLEPVGGPNPPRGSVERTATLTLAAAFIFQPILHPTGPGNSSPVDLLTLASILMFGIWATTGHRKLRAPYFFPLALYVAAGAASGLAGLLPGTSLLALADDLLLFAWCTTVVNLLSSPRTMRCALAAWSWSGIFWAGVVIVSWTAHITVLLGLTPAEGNRVLFTFGDPNYASMYWVATIFVVYSSRTPASRWMRITGYLMLGWALALTESNGGALSLGAGICFLLLVRSYRRRGWVGAAATGLGIALAVGTFFTAVPLHSIRQWALASGQPLLVNSLGRSQQSGAERGQLVTELRQLYQGSDGLVGLGPASTKPLLALWQYPYSNEAHNDYLAALVERGALGLLAFLLLVASAVSRASPIMRRPLSAPFAAAVPRPAGLIAGLLALALNSFYEEIQHFRFVWALLAIVAVLGRDAMRRPAGSRPAGILSRPRVTRYRPRGLGQISQVSRAAASNLGAQACALASLSAASLLVARIGGPTVLGYYALLRVMPWLFGVVISCGLPTAAAFFLAGENRQDPRLRPTLSLMAVIGAGISALAWLACAVPFHAVFFRHMPVGLVLIMAIPVVTWLWNVTAKACCQGSGDIAGANLLIVAEEIWFIPSYLAVLLLAGNRGAASVVAALIISGALYTGTGLVRLWRRRFFAGWGLPSARLARRIAAFGARGQLGNMLWLMNLRFDFILLGALAGPAVLGIYAVASKFAELMRLVPTAMNYVLYPRFARLGREQATAEGRRLLPRATMLTLAMTPLLAVVIVVALPVLYGRAFRGAIAPAEIIVIGLSIEGAAAVSSAYLLGSGRPGLNSLGMGVGAAITVTLDIILIPRYGAIGGAVTSAVTYVASTITLTWLARRVAREIWPAGAAPRGGRAQRDHREAPGELRCDTAVRRGIDIIIACAALLVASPLLLAAALAVKATSRGPVLYKQVRAGKSGQPFTMLKFRSMVAGADRAGPLVTGRADPRITRVGALLRATKLDELPQLCNVLRGDMTVIGPRPEVPRFLPSYHEDELKILDVRPGLTGPGQIFYTEVQADDDPAADPEVHYVSFQLHPKLAIDLDYLRRRSLRADLGILLHTAALVCHLGRRAPLPAATEDARRP